MSLGEYDRPILLWRLECTGLIWTLSIAMFDKWWDFYPLDDSYSDGPKEPAKITWICCKTHFCWILKSYLISAWITCCKTHIFVGNTQSTGSMIGNMLQWLSVRILDWCCPFFSDKGTHCQSGKYGHEACYSLERPNSSLGFTNYTHHYILGYPQILEPRTSSRFIGYSDSHILMYNHIHISWYPYCDWFF